jgi:hypothetical protein
MNLLLSIGKKRNLAHFTPWRLAFGGALLTALVGSGPAQARSTLALRFSTPVLAGPEIEQPVALYLHYFPGDGEAVLAARLNGDPGQVEVKAAHSALGRARSADSLVEIDYRARPLGREQVDTLQLTVVIRAGAARCAWQGSLFTTADSVASPGGTASLELAPPLQVAVELRPPLVFAGEQIRLEALVRNADTRPLGEVAWQWPQGLVIDPGQARHSWAPPLEPGGQDTVVWQARIEAQAAGPLVVRGRAGAPEVAGSPLPETALQVVAAPLVQVAPVQGAWLEVGRPGRLRCQWQNPGGDTLEIAAWRIEIPAAFARVRVVQASQGKAMVQQNAVLVQEVGRLAPGQTAQVELEATPQRAGPFNWNCAFRPAQRPDFIPASGQTALRVAETRADQPPAEVAGAPTDLELLRQAFAQAAETGLGQLPLPPGARICLEPYEKSEKNWVLDDALVGVLMRQGYQVLLVPEPGAGVLRYRLADSRVVFTPGPRGWNPFGGRQRREAYGELFLRLEGPGGRIEWMRRVLAYRADVVPAGRAGGQTASALFRSTRVEDQHKGIERGLSASIIGGLFYIFFIP